MTCAGAMANNSLFMNASPKRRAQHSACYAYLRLVIIGPYRACPLARQGRLSSFTLN